MLIKYDNCKSCVSKCEHAGKDREFICRGGVSCKVEGLKRDIVEVVRCRDCKNHLYDDDVDFLCGHTGMFTRFDDFCSYGERKNNATD